MKKLYKYEKEALRKIAETKLPWDAWNGDCARLHFMDVVRNNVRGCNMEAIAKDYYEIQVLFNETEELIAEVNATN